MELSILFLYMAAAADNAYNIIYGFLLSVRFPFQKDIKQRSAVKVQFVGGTRIDRSNLPDNIIVKGMNHKRVKAGFCKGKETVGILVKKKKGVSNVNLVIKRFHTDGTAAFFQISLYDFMQIVVERISAGMKIVIKSHP